MIKNEPLIQSYEISEAELPSCQRLSIQQIALLQNEAANLVNNLINIYFTGNLQEDTQAIRSYIHDQARYTYIVEKIRESNDAWQQQPN
jgi:hypothetical protein